MFEGLNNIELSIILSCITMMSIISIGCGLILGTSIIDMIKTSVK